MRPTPLIRTICLVPRVAGLEGVYTHTHFTCFMVVVMVIAYHSELDDAERKQDDIKLRIPFYLYTRM